MDFKRKRLRNLSIPPWSFRDIRIDACWFRKAYNNSYSKACCSLLLVFASTQQRLTAANLTERGS